MIDPRLQTLRVLRELGTVTAAAHALHLTPSSVSQQLRQLAREVGVELLEADGRRVRLTPAAHTLLGHADLMFAQWQRARADLAAHGDGTAGTLRLCGGGTVLAALVAPAAARLRDERPRMDVRLSEEENEDCPRLLLADRTDVAVMVPAPDGPPPDDPRFEQEILLDEPIDLLVPAYHRLAERPRVALADAATENWISTPGAAAHNEMFYAACATAGFSPRVAHQVKGWFGISALVSCGFGVCLIPRLTPIAPGHDVVRIPFAGTPAPARRIITCIRRGSRHQPAIADGLTALHQVADRLGPALTGRSA
jgi:DNA-binding transcriptional LysR family regulator